LVGEDRPQASRSGLHQVDLCASIDSMAQLIVRNLEDDIRDKIRAMADTHGRSMEEEIRDILREAALRTSFEAGLGTRLAARFSSCGLDTEIEELRGQPARSADLKP